MLYNLISFYIKKKQQINKKSSNFIMQSSKNSTSKTNKFFFDKNATYIKSNQIRSTKNLNISLGANQSLGSLNLYHHHQQKPSYEIKNDFPRNIRIRSKQQDNNSSTINDIYSKLNTFAKQNQKLKQQNDLLKKQLSRIKKYKNDSHHHLMISKQKYTNKVYSCQQSKQKQHVDLRNTIKREEIGGDNKQLKIKLEILSKQCKHYEEIIDKMENTIRRLTDQNKLLNSKKKNQDKMNQKQGRKQEFQNLKEKVNMIMKEYSDLESKMHSNQLEWVIWKQQWITEKNIYLNKIRQLEYRLKQKKMD